MANGFWKILIVEGLDKGVSQDCLLPVSAQKLLYHFPQKVASPSNMCSERDFLSLRASWDLKDLLNLSDLGLNLHWVSSSLEGWWSHLFPLLEHATRSNMQPGVTCTLAISACDWRSTIWVKPPMVQKTWSKSAHKTIFGGLGVAEDDALPRLGILSWNSRKCKINLEYE